MSERPEARWGRPIGNEELTAELLPEANAPWSELVFFAGTLNGYEVAGPGPSELLGFADPIAGRWREHGELPDDLTALRVALFAEQRRDHFSDSAGDPQTMRYIHALVDAIRTHVLGRDPENAPAGPDVQAEAPPAPLRGLGVDGARGGWAVACLYADALRREDAQVWETRLLLRDDITHIARLREEAGGTAVVAIDVPIGLPDSVDFRACDVEARARLKRRANSVFAPPARYMLDAADDYAAIRALVDERRQTDPAAKSLSAQAAGIAPKVAEVDVWVRAHPDSERWLFECHPELSFLALNGGAPLAADKRSTAGVMRRLALVRHEFSDAEAQLAAAEWSSKQVELSDLLDAYAALTTAVVCARGEQEELGDGERDSQDVLMRMAL